MGKLNISGRSGDSHEVTYENGRKLMEVLRDNDMVRAECGGMQICATCHVLIDPVWHHVAGTASESEAEMLDGTGDYVVGRSRLSCQIILSGDHDGMALTLGPEL